MKLEIELAYTRPALGDPDTARKIKTVSSLPQCGKLTVLDLAQVVAVH